MDAPCASGARGRRSNHETQDPPSTGTPSKCLFDETPTHSVGRSGRFRVILSSGISPVRRMPATPLPCIFRSSPSMAPPCARRRRLAGTTPRRLWSISPSARRNDRPRSVWAFAPPTRWTPSPFQTPSFGGEHRRPIGSALPASALPAQNDVVVGIRLAPASFLLQFAVLFCNLPRNRRTAFLWRTAR